MANKQFPSIQQESQIIEKGFEQMSLDKSDTTPRTRLFSSMTYTEYVNNFEVPPKIMKLKPKTSDYDLEEFELETPTKDDTIEGNKSRHGYSSNHSDKTDFIINEDEEFNLESKEDVFELDNNSKNNQNSSTSEKIRARNNSDSMISNYQQNPVQIFKFLNQWNRQ